MKDELGGALRRLERAGRRRVWPPTERAGADFASNDYLGFTRRAELVEAARDATQRYGVGSGAARLLGGAAEASLRAERTACEWLGTESALLLPSGYQANLGCVAALAGRGDALYSDELNHASIVDAARLSRAHVEVYPHNDVAALERALARGGGARRRLVVSETVFGMDGDIAPLAELAEACARHDAWLVLDEAHAIGLLGPAGRGAWDAALQRGADPARLAARVVTGGKALGVSGAFVVGAPETIEWLANTARAFVFSTAPPPAVAATLERAIPLAAGADAERATALAHARELARALGLAEPAAAIVPFIVGPDQRAVELAARSNAQGLDVRAVRPPTVPEGTARLRLVAHAHNTSSEVERLAAALSQQRRAVPHVAASERHGARTVCVVGTDTDIGKTVVSAALALAAPEGWRYWKPVQTGADDDTATVRAATGLGAERFAEPLHHFPLPASPHEAARAAGGSVSMAELDGALDELLAVSRGILLELAGGLLVPYDDAATQADWIAARRPTIVLVARSGLGTLNHTLLTIEALERRALAPRALVLCGERHASNAATLRARLAPLPLFELPRLPRVARAELEAWVRESDIARTVFGSQS